MAKVFKGFNLNLGTKKEVKMLRDVLSSYEGTGEEENRLINEIIEAIDDKVSFDNDVNTDGACD